MSGYVLTRAAQADLDQIWDYTEQRWSEDQAERYVGAIRDICAAVGSGETVGVSTARFRRGYFRHAVGSHFVFYTIGDTGLIQVMRILHQRMDIQSHIQE